MNTNTDTVEAAAKRKVTLSPQLKEKLFRQSVYDEAKEFVALRADGTPDEMEDYAEIAADFALSKLRKQQAALDSRERELKQYREALEYYADSKRYRERTFNESGWQSGVTEWRGKACGWEVAQAALKGKEERQG